jgi:hypothetical protein
MNDWYDINSQVPMANLWRERYGNIREKVREISTFALWIFL